MLSEAVVRDQLARMLASSVFARSPRLRAFLEFTVEETLAGRGDSLKEPVIATELYGKRFGFDPGIDATVRVDARRLRDKLREYYAENPGDAVVISLPKGSYVPSFNGPPPATRPGVRALLLWRLALAFAVGCAGIAAVVALRPDSAQRFERVKTRRLSRSGSVVRAALSPDGRMVAFASGESGAAGAPTGPESLRIRRVDSATDTELVPPGDHHFAGLTFSPDGAEVDYALRPPGDGPASLFRVNVRGGPARRIIHHVDSPSTFSADGSRLAFVREQAADGESVLMVANRDGSGERRIAARKLPEYLDYPAWSPDGRSIACTLVQPLTQQAGVVLIDPATGVVKRLGQTRWRFIRGLSWSGDGRFLVLAGSPRNAVLFRVWAVEQATGGVAPLSGEADDIVRVHMPMGATRLVGIQRWKTSRLVLTPTRRTGEPIDVHRWTTALTRSVVGGGGSRAVAWTKDGRIISEAEYQLFVSQPDGSDLRQLTSSGENTRASVCDDGRHVLYQSSRSGLGEVWRVAIDGGKPVRLAGGAQFGRPVCGPGSRWFLAAMLTHGGWPALYKGSVAGGEPVKLSQSVAEKPAVTRDGNLIAYFTGAPATSQWVIRAIEIVGPDGGPPLKRFPVTGNVDTLAGLNWTPDGSGIAYAMHREGSANVWVQPVDGGPQRQLTNFQTSRIFAFEWSWDGTQLGVSLGTEPSDMVLIEYISPGHKNQAP